MTPMARWGCRFWTVNDGQPRSVEYIRKVMREKIKDQSPFEYEFRDGEDDSMDDMDQLENAKQEKVAERKQQRIDDLESKLVESREQVRSLSQDIFKLKQQIMALNITPITSPESASTAAAAQKTKLNKGTPKAKPTARGANPSAKSST
mmetsp:Transcript_35274/g.68611  ORF Transcript_35274/g.68611 Transcript_35274/m.68611 type:complete len:149 (-) Transcript_35274:105-551(-)